ncbi:MAG: FtsX-like permease family protein [Candidatus Thorarchaeota archaeon]|nr:FtsX-like permease family protein [Candidatus Thorarchaeota archaeon]
MAEMAQREMLKGSIWWPPSYAVTSLWNHKARNIGIALILAISVSIPTTVFIWTGTGTSLAVDEYFEENAYQINLRVQSSLTDYSALIEARDYALASPFIEYAHVVPSSVCILQGDWDDWTLYNIGYLNYREGIKDGRIILGNNEMLDAFSTELEWRGQLTLNPGEVVVSEFFVESAADVHGVTIDVGSIIDIDLLRFGAKQRPKDDEWATPEELGRVGLKGLRVVGIFKVVRVSMIGQLFTSKSRLNWDPLGRADTVLGMNDSVIMLQDQLDPAVVNDVSTRGYFSPVGLLRASAEGLKAAGTTSVTYNLVSLKIRLEEMFPELQVTGLTTIAELQGHIATYVRSQILIILALPVMVMSLMLTIFTSETSISYRKGEISALRAKGASFNQIFAAVIWESVALAVLGFIVGFLLSLVMAPLMGASTGLLTFSTETFQLFLENAVVPLQAIILAAAISMYLPAAYLLHVARRIDVAEVGQPTSRNEYEVPEETNPLVYPLGLTVVLSLLVAMPIIITPVNEIALIQLLIATLGLFASSYLGSRGMRIATAYASGRITPIIGEKSLYLRQSLRRRKGQFIPLLVILTLTLTTTTMVLIQTQSLETTLDREMRYSIGADMRVETYGTPLSFFDTIENFPGVEEASPVVHTTAVVGAEQFWLEGIYPMAYLNVANFDASSFVSGTPESVLTSLNATENGIVISQFYSEIWSRAIGDQVTVLVATIDSTIFVDFEVVGIMKSAPGFGMAARADLKGAPFGDYFGFQVTGPGFALVNLEYLTGLTSIDEVEVFFVDITSYEEVQPLVEAIESDKNAEIYTVENVNLSDLPGISPFLSGTQGLAMISYVLCAAMGLSAIGLFLGSAVSERQSEYAVFRALGGTKKQVVSMVFGEFAGLILAALAISFILGIVFGYVMTSLTLGISMVFPILAEAIAFPVVVMLLTLALEGLVMVIACYIPARNAGSVDPAKVLRNL